MTITEFLRSSEQSFGNGKVRLMPAQESAYIQKLSVFTGDQLSAIYDKVLELTEHFPKIKHIYDAARDLGYLQTESQDFKPHRWRFTDCRLCSGEGRLCVTWKLTYEIQDERRVEVHALSRIIPYTFSCNSDNFKLEADEFRSLFRCECLAGDAASLPKAWPKWSRSVSPVRYR